MVVSPDPAPGTWWVGRAPVALAAVGYQAASLKVPDGLGGMLRPDRFAS